MKKRISISLIAVATTMLLMLAIIPHHHHHGLWCNEVELCVTDQDINDKHTHHSDDHTSCVEHLNYVAAKYVVSKSPIQQLQHIIFCVPSVASNDDYFYPKYTRLERYTERLFYKFQYINGSNALRAPPVA